MLIILPFLPETPRWLASRDRHEEALVVLQRLYYKRLPDDEVLRMHDMIVGTVALETSANSGKWSHLWKSDGMRDFPCIELDHG